MFKGYNFIGVEPSAQMLEIAKSKSNNIDWRLGTAENIPLPNSAVSNVIATLTVHHWVSLEDAFKEIYRVLLPKGNYWLNHYFPKMMQYSIAQMPKIETLEKILSLSGLIHMTKEEYFVSPNLEDYFYLLENIDRKSTYKKNIGKAYHHSLQ